MLLCLIGSGCGPLLLDPSPPPEPPGLRAFVRATHERLSPLLPPGDRGALTSEQLPALLQGDLYRHFGQDPRWLTSVFGNFWGLVHTSQATKGDPGADQDLRREPPPWPGFSSTWVPVAEGARLFARLGGQPGQDAVILAVGLFGDLAGPRYRDLSQVLQKEGYQVLSLELRGHGRTGFQQPQLPMTFGVLEAADLIEAAGWLRRERGARRVGLVGFSWGALDAILASWIDGETRTDNPLWRHLPRPGARPVFDGGVLALSPVLDVVGIADSFESQASFLGDPARYYLQRAIKGYMVGKGAPRADHRVWPFVRYELARSSLRQEFASADETLRRVVAFLQVQGPAGAAKLERVRAPLLVVHGANDPIALATQVVDVGARVKNRNVSVLLLPGSGHIGLSALSADYYYGLVLSFLAAQRDQGVALAGR